MSDVTTPLYDDVSCSQCGRGFGPGDHGYSHCDQHQGYARDIAEVRERLKTESGRLASIAEDIDPKWTTPEEIDIDILTAIEHLLAARRLVLSLGGRK